MKKTGMLILLVSLFGILNAQQFPEVNLKTLDGKISIAHPSKQTENLLLFAFGNHVVLQMKEC